MNGSEAKLLAIAPREIKEDEPETVATYKFSRVVFPSEPTAEQRMRIVEASEVLDFWDRPEEDIYSLEDGEPV